jgi:hypothetical protein
VLQRLDARRRKGSGIDVTDDRQTLEHYPWPVVSVASRYCDRREWYRIETLIAAYGREATYAQVLTSMTADCTRASDRTSRPGGCRGAYFPDIEKKRR